MLDLDSPRWQELQDAYGVATKIPELLSQLQSDTRPKAAATDEPWFSLWSALCNQGNIFTASYAALPRIVQIGMQANGEIDPFFFHLPHAIELARVTGRGPGIPNDLFADYVAALPNLGHIKLALHERSVIATTPENQQRMDDDNGLCKQCGHPFDPHLVIALDASNPTNGGIILCPEETCSCFNTWDFKPKPEASNS